ncbi:DUF3613 domain-containing protein [Halomonas sp. 328]|uniref:DUF3613 domain-containing protein n=1 Tax=Halomonas sp. 328 TaxID=2776704 RepID=UPI001E2FF182|nr:DUF3613 domain-containing protein [Halomonas sp. 328]
MNGFIKISASCLVMLGLGLGGSALAQGTTADSRGESHGRSQESAPRVTAGSRSVQGMLELQRSQQLASPHRQHVSGDVQARIYRRYVESFSHPIPERYIDTRFSGQ